jgi:hypothetical protein
MRPALLSLALLAACAGPAPEPTPLSLDAGASLDACPYAIVFVDGPQYLAAACRITAWEDRGPGHFSYAHVDCVTDGGIPVCPGSPAP